MRRKLLSRRSRVCGERRRFRSGSFRIWNLAVWWRHLVPWMILGCFTCFVDNLFEDSLCLFWIKICSLHHCCENYSQFEGSGTFYFHTLHHLSQFLKPDLFQTSNFSCLRTQIPTGPAIIISLPNNQTSFRAQQWTINLKLKSIHRLQLKKS